MTEDRLLSRPAWAPSWVPAAADEARVRWLRRAAVVLAVLGVVACVNSGTDSPADPELSGPAVGTEVTVPDTEEPTVCTPGVDADAFGEETQELLDTFGTAVIEVSEGDTAVPLCVLHASTGDQRARGLMQVTEFDGFDGMLFSYDEVSSGAYYMFNTPTSLSIYWFGADGSLTRTVDMEPCLDSPPEECPRYPAGGEFLYAVEVPAGALRDAGIGDNPVLRIAAGG